jgi:hypothetical protein
LRPAVYCFARQRLAERIQSSQGRRDELALAVGGGACGSVEFDVLLDDQGLHFFKLNFDLCRKLRRCVSDWIGALLR